MNSFGRSFRLSILGESHGPCVGILLDGCPAGLALDEADFAAGHGAPARRRRPRHHPAPGGRRAQLPDRGAPGPQHRRADPHHLREQAGRFQRLRGDQEHPAARPRGLGGAAQVRRFRGYARQRALLRAAHGGAGGGRRGGQEAAGAGAGGGDRCWRRAAAPTSSRRWRRPWRPRIQWAGWWSAGCAICRRAWANPSSIRWSR